MQLDNLILSLSMKILRLTKAIMTFEHWILNNDLQHTWANVPMMLSRKRFPTSLSHPLTLNGWHPNEVERFRSFT